ncbi:biopolymer transporter Tol [Heliobacillus mobilis]|uniref:Biopolymer transporter Tol n=1 Tax=Heliobacterium mobile TaxID=28064 RepID=A0A6I3SHV0_HELMO|nr:PD40 domain-containing protein [Heliobacterium mobile]MTV48375.1 biopolymer transporter Tol [Heliobacterium mobile]
MKNSRFIRPAMRGAAMSGIITAVIWLNQPLQLPFFNQLDATAHAQSVDTEQAPSLSELPGVNAIDFKGQGKLAFISKGLLYVLDGNTKEVKQLTEFGSALKPVWSHDGEWLAFKLVTDKNSKTGPLWLIRKDGTQAHQVQGLPGAVMTQFSWSPTSNTLTVSSEDGLWLVSTEGTPVQLVKTPNPFPSFCWSPDGKSLAYNISLPNEKTDTRDDHLFTVEIDAGKPVKRLQTPDTGIKLAEWQPDGKGLIFWQIPLHSASITADGVSLYCLQLDNSQPKLLTTGLTYKEWHSFSPEGQLLTVEGVDRVVWANKSLTVVNPNSGQQQHIANPNGYVAIDPHFSPDGKNIAYVAARNLGSDVWGFGKKDALKDWINSRTLYIASADGSNARALPVAGQGIYQPTWSKDGRHILFVKNKALWIVNIEGLKVEKILDLDSDQEEEFGFYGFISYEDYFSWYKG